MEVRNYRPATRLCCGNVSVSLWVVRADASTTPGPRCSTSFAFCPVRATHGAYTTANGLTVLSSRWRFGRRWRAEQAKQLDPTYGQEPDDEDTWDAALGCAAFLRPSTISFWLTKPAVRLSCQIWSDKTAKSWTSARSLCSAASRRVRSVWWTSGSAC